jgi:hypothetical protein
MAQRRKHVKHTATFEARLAEEARKLKEAAEQQPPGSSARELLLRRARQAETAYARCVTGGRAPKGGARPYMHINDWLTSPGLQPPKSVENLLADQRK